jgi:hypothetical protein
MNELEGNLIKPFINKQNKYLEGIKEWRNE